MRFESIRKLNRFTTLPVLLDLLKRKKLVLLNPESWDDKNDSGIILEYKKRRSIRDLFAVCFSMGDETIHHWKAFADGTSGCCIEFNGEELVECISTIKGVKYGKVKYLKLKEVLNGSVDVNKIPFTKRWPYRCEEEFRIIWEGECKAKFFEIDIDLHMINKITISQRMPDQIYATIREHLRDVFRNPDQRINRSTIYANRLWLSKFRKS